VVRPVAGLSAANKNRNTNQLLVAPRTVLTTVSEVWGIEVTNGASMDGMGGCGAMIITVALLSSFETSVTHLC
jgi:hypothetical protein